MYNVSKYIKSFNLLKLVNFEDINIKK